MGGLVGSYEFERLRDRTAAVIAELMAATESGAADAVRERLTAAAQRLRDDRLTVVVCGEFKRGKSSLLNALLEERSDLFPVDAVVATSLVTTVTWHEREQVEVTVATDGGVEERPISRAEIAGYATEAGNPDNVKQARMISVRTPNPRLAGGVTIVDTPGVGGVFAEHTAVTMGFLPMADAIVFVSDFTQPLLASELAFLTQASQAAALSGDLDGLVFAVTKADRVGPEEREVLLANTVAKLATATGSPPEALSVVAVSSLAKMDYLADGDPQDLADSNFERFESMLWSAVQRRSAKLILGTALTDVELAVQALLHPLDTEQEALRAGTEQKLVDLRAQAEERRAQLAALERNKADWVAELRRGMEDVGRDLKRDARRQLIEIWHRCDSEYLFDTGYLNNPDSLMQRLAADASLVAGALGERAQHQAAAVQRAFAARHGLELRHPQIEALPPPTVRPIAIAHAVGEPRADRRVWDKTLGGMEGGGYGGSVGLTIGMIVGSVFPVVGTVIGGLVGGALGGLIGGAKGVADVTAYYDQRDLEARRSSIRMELGQIRLTQEYDLDEGLDVLIRGLVEGVTVELTSRIEQEQESVGNAQQALTGLHQSTMDEANTRREEIDATRAPLLRAQAEVTAIAEQAARLGITPDE